MENVSMACTCMYLLSMHNYYNDLYIHMPYYAFSMNSHAHTQNNTM